MLRVFLRVSVTGRSGDYCGEHDFNRHEHGLIDCDGAV